jgi:hypothetical protein
MVAKKQNLSLNESTLLTRQNVCDILHIGLSSLDSLPTYRELKRVHIGRHTFFLHDDVMEFILAHREGAAK